MLFIIFTIIQRIEAFKNEGNRKIHTSVDNKYRMACCMYNTVESTCRDSLILRRQHLLFVLSHRRRRYFSFIFNFFITVVLVYGTFRFHLLFLGPGIAKFVPSQVLTFFVITCFLQDTLKLRH
jgi:hypothetical protein